MMISLNEEPGILVKSVLQSLRYMKCDGMASELEIQLGSPAVYAEMPVMERVARIVQAEEFKRNQAKAKRLARKSNVNDGRRLDTIWVSSSRGFTNEMRDEILSRQMFYKPYNVLVMGASGTGKTELLRASGRTFLNAGISVFYYKTHDLLADLAVSDKTRRDKMLTSIAKVQLLILDEFGLFKIDEQQMFCLYQVMESRYETKPTMFGTQLSEHGLSDWMPKTACMQSIMRRIVQNSMRIHLSGNPLKGIPEEKIPVEALPPGEQAPNDGYSAPPSANPDEEQKHE